MKIGRFVVDGHIHCGKKDSAKADSKLKGIWAEVESVDNSDMILFDMDVYGVDMGILLPSFTGTTNEMYKYCCERHPKRLRTCAMDCQTRIKAAHGEKEWNLSDSLKELDEVLTNGKDYFVGIGEFAPGCMGVVRKSYSNLERFDEWCAVAELAIAHDVPIFFHDYSDPTGLSRVEAFQVLNKVLAKYPELKVVIPHGGGDNVADIKEACLVASRAPFVYLETGYWRAEYYEIALKDHQLGASRLIWGGGDTGSRLWYPQATRPNAKYLEPTKVWYNRNNWNGDKREADYQPDFYGWPTRQIARLIDLDLATQDEINLIVGGNAARLYKLPVPELCTFACGRPDILVK
ncbi:MAG: amidohydrolase family protein [Oscillospiraceae bacterium]|nr:amidohydrolase family protein [Oscillospiraceae bacterium]